jgi:hypothetical protein
MDWEAELSQQRDKVALATWQTWLKMPIKPVSGGGVVWEHGIDLTPGRESWWDWNLILRRGEDGVWRTADREKPDELFDLIMGSVDAGGVSGLWDRHGLRIQWVLAGEEMPGISWREELRRVGEANGWERPPSDKEGNGCDERSN